MSIDLHCHTKFSDGSVSIDDLVMLAKKNGVTTISVTDHDIFDATERARIAGRKFGVNVIPGVELSARDNGREIHILAYLMKNPDRLIGLCHNNTNSRRREAQYIALQLSKIFNLGTDFLQANQFGSSYVSHSQFMTALMHAGYTTELYGDLYKRYFDPASSDYIVVRPAKFSTVEFVINEIHEAGGLAVLAHPAMYDGIETVEKYKPLGLDGIEVWHPTADENTTSELLAYAQENGLLATGGSDFHGMFNRKPCGVGSVTMPEDALAALEAAAV